MLRSAIGVMLALAAAAAAVPSAEPANPVPYPEAYRQWTHVKTAIVGPGNPGFAKFGGVHHIYANEHAMRGYREGSFPDGSIIVFDLLEMQTKDDVISEGPRRHVDVMHKDTKRFAATGGWGFDEFRGGSRTERNVGDRAVPECFECHAKRKDADFVYSAWRE
ncbi:MAG TPA: cytochrome P460 family protein [Steroidobacteraceae bacterium]|nr:cytochrome P460 family protein [Steroidobacteraceae bacterium]